MSTAPRLVFRPCFAVAVPGAASLGTDGGLWRRLIVLPLPAAPQTRGRP